MRSVNFFRPTLPEIASRSEFTITNSTPCSVRGACVPSRPLSWELIRSLILLVLSASFVVWASDKPGSLDPEFAKFPFDQWLVEHDQGRFHWTLSAPHTGLSFHQRMVAALDLKVDGKDLDSRRGDSLMMFLIQVTDAEGTRYQDHGSLDLSKLSSDVKATTVDYSQNVFVLPGEYRLAVAIVDTATGEHSTRLTSFKVASQHDFLIDAWRGLPPVEFIAKAETPDSWFLPAVRSPIQWAASVHSPARLNVILNVDTSEATAAAWAPTHTGPSSGLAALLPSLKAISQTGSASISEQVELIDIARRQAVFDQADVHELDWARLKPALAGASSASIDVHALSDRQHDAQFFVSQVRKMLRASDKPSVLVVLTQPVGFESDEDLEPISTEALPDCRVIYIRYHAPMEHPNPLDQQTRGRGRGRFGGPMGGGPMGNGTMNRNRPLEVRDRLEGTLKPLSPKVFDVDAPDQVTKALAETLKALGTP